MAPLFVLSEHYRSADKSGVREYSGGRAASVSLRIFFWLRQKLRCVASRPSVDGKMLAIEPRVRCGAHIPKRNAIHLDGISFWQAAPIKISTVFLVFSMVSAFLARFLELAASYCWLLLCNQKRYCGFYGIWCGLHDSVSDLHFDGFPVLRGSGHKSACSAQRG